MYNYYKVSLLHITNKAETTSKKLKKKFYIDGIEIIDRGYDPFAYNYKKFERVHVLYVVIKDRENKFLDSYVKDTLSKMNIETNEIKLVITDKGIENLKTKGFI